jgi:hypothetical protein
MVAMVTMAMAMVTTIMMIMGRREWRAVMLVAALVLAVALAVEKEAGGGGGGGEHDTVRVLEGFLPLKRLRTCFSTGLPDLCVFSIDGS